MKLFNFGFVIGRFQGLHDGHTRMIHTALSLCENVLVLVGSSSESGTVRNPFTLKTRMDALRAEFGGNILLGHIDDLTNEDDHSHEWGDYVLNKVGMWANHYNVPHELDCMIYGNDEERSSWYKPEEIERITQIALARPEGAISATATREAIAGANEITFRSLTPRATWDMYEEYRNQLMDIPHYVKTGTLVFRRDYDDN